MKNKVLGLVAIVAVALSTVSFTVIDSGKKEVKTAESKVVWKGTKVGGEHTGTVALQSGSLEFKGKKLIGGEFVVDMTTIVSTDMKGEWGNKLNGHLKSDDFFGVEKFPTSTLTFKEVKSLEKNTYFVVADLSIKGQTHPVKFTLTVMENKAKTEVTVDRTKYDIKYGSGIIGTAADKVIHDDFTLAVELHF